MNKVILMGRLTRDPDIRYSAGENSTAVARYTLAVDRRFKRDGDQTADFINCVAFGRSAEFAEKYLRQGIRMVVSGRIQTGSYTNRDGVKVYTTDVVVEEQEFAESKKASEEHRSQSSGLDGFDNENSGQSQSQAPASADGFMNIPDGIDEELPFN
ncbi:single-stranded DNA-binding protein [Blautia liquoris]|uniref:Single-stranded DNA-binding protein n=1 Tax=Blautia liquoris TaxID=2779518 RepID=A0A7M2RJI1_9FIRM|nr:single-stranded DNA-binding protein [Blautia liquoris]QOV20154.1 single-stranded DNA-binding protein [Blautia liquoris]